MYRNYRLISTLAVLIIYFAISFPQIAFVLFFLGIIAVVFWICYKNISTKGSEGRDATKTARRQAALRVVSMYLSPHDPKKIWTNITISNKYSSIKINHSGRIVATEKTGNNTSYRKFTVFNSRVYDIDELFNLFCINYNHNKNYDDLIDDCRLFRADIKEDIIGNPTNTTQNTGIKVENIKASPKLDTYTKTDINNASEVELTALPGISIVISKKIIKKREELGGFKNIDEFFLFLKLKPHMEKQLREIVFVTKMKGSVKIELNSERKVDL